MAASSNPKIQKLMDEVSTLDNNDENLEHKLQKIAKAVAAEQQNMRAALTGQAEVSGPVDPADAFACDGCQ